MQVLTVGLGTLLFIVIVGVGLARMLGTRDLEASLTRHAVALALVLLALPTVGQIVAALGKRTFEAARAGIVTLPSLGVGHVVVALVVLVGHIALALWWLRRRARGSGVITTARTARRRTRMRLPPLDLDGGA